MLARLKRRLRSSDDRGATAVEIGLLIAGAAVVVVPSIMWLQSQLATNYRDTVADEPGVCATPDCDAIGDVPTPPFTNTVNFGPPGAPTSFSGVGGNGSAVLSWAAPLADGGAPVTAYAVSGSPSGSCSTVPPTLTCTVSGLSNGTPYSFNVTATNANGTGSAATTSVTPTAATPPSSPTSFVATPGNGQVALTWAAPSALNGSTLTGYVLTVTGAGAPGPQSYGSAASTATITGLTNGTAYSFSLVATSNVGDGAAATQSATPRTVPGAPTSVVGTAGNAQVSVAWVAPASTGGSAILDYTATASPGGATCTSASSPCVVTGLTNGTGYTFTVTARNAAGSGPASAASTSVIPLTSPGAPTSVVGTAGNAQVSVAWVAPASTGGSAILDYTATASPGGATCTSASSPCVVTGLTNGTGYTFTVTARNAGGSGPSSTASASVTPRTVPGAPTGLSGTSGSSKVDLSWTAPAANGAAITDYIVQYRRQSVAGWSTFADGTSTSTTASVTGLIPGVSYVFQVAAVNAAGTGAYSSTATAPATGTCAVLAAVSLTGVGSAPRTVTVLPSDLAGGKVTATAKTSAANTGTVAVTAPTSAQVQWSGYSGNRTWIGTYSYTATNCSGTRTGNALSLRSN